MRCRFGAQSLMRGRWATETRCAKRPFGVVSWTGLHLHSGLTITGASMEAVGIALVGNPQGRFKGQP